MIGGKSYTFGEDGRWINPVAASESEMRAALRRTTSSTVQFFDRRDYDGDGLEEAFAFMGNIESSGFYINTSLWFISSECDVQLVATEWEAGSRVNGAFKDPNGSGYSFLSLEADARGSSSIS